MTSYFFGIEDITENDRFDGYIHKATIGYHGPLETEGRVKVVEPEGITWLNGKPLQFVLREEPVDNSPLASNRPTEDDSDSLTEETLSYERTILGPQSPEKTDIYHPITSDGILEVLLRGERRIIRLTLVAEYFEHSDILHDSLNVVELNAPEQDQIPAIAA